MSTETAYRTGTTEFAPSSASHALYGGIVALAADAIVVADAAQRILLFNRGAEETFGYTAAEVLGHPLDVLLPARFAERHRAHLVPEFTHSPVEARRMAERGEVYGRRKSGEEFPAEVAISRTVVDGELRFSAIVRDVSARVRQEAALRESEARFRSIFDSAFQFVGLLAPDGTLLEANRASLAFAGVGADAVLGRAFWDTPWWTHADHARQQLRDAVARAAAGEFVRFETEHRGGNGEFVTVDFSLKPMAGPEGRVGLLIAEGRDVTEARRLAARLEQQRADLARSNAELEQFAYVASHDLQEPLRAVASYTQLLAERYAGELDERAQRYIRYAVQGAERMQSLIGDLLALSRVGTHAQPFACASLDDVLDETVRAMEFAIADAGATVTHDPLPSVLGDAAELGQLFQNLLANALKFRRPGVPPNVHVSASDGDVWTIAVRDNGIGIDPRFADRIFVIFKRLHTRDEYPGTGIGLAICKKVVERHGGRIWVEGDPEGGSVFRFTLPHADAPTRADETPR